MNDYILQEADFLLGDIAMSWERRRAVEFSFFTLVDSGAFVTHAPKRLNEALALVRPFRWQVWPPLVFTIAVTGPLFYFVIAVPFWWRGAYKQHTVASTVAHRPSLRRNKHAAQIRWYSDRHVRVECGAYHLTQLNRMRFGPRQCYADPIVRKIDKRIKRVRVEADNQLPDNLLNKCIWFAITLFLRQCKHNTHHTQ